MSDAIGDGAYPLKQGGRARVKSLTPKQRMMADPAIMVRENEERRKSTTGNYVIGIRVGDDHFSQHFHDCRKVYVWGSLDYKAIGVSGGKPAGMQMRSLVLRQPTLMENGRVKYAHRRPFVEFTSVDLRAEPHVRTGFKTPALCKTHVEETEFGPRVWYLMPDGIVLKAI